ncbi:hypothetical protein JDV02_008094 [Purpureocillium takamizusanense]|uniref:Uncharacterized protein n=1 Tax=Purpureocillium takamizusanense TaxID=2060973 RepID=A0A9Q8QLG2_9HYPO|nr:uncharacterized protein JDV02_008094 [Purpureocillium takamizusanense]UNI22183.1 hypothetical protein JDV02_008094 [Purpureocillium takamizusanense]
MAVLLMLARAVLKPPPSVATALIGDNKLANATANPNPQQHNGLLQGRAPEPQQSTCGFLNGDASKPRTADPGFNCRVDTQNGLWGFCPTSVVYADDCGFAGSCVDDHGCSTACGLTDTTTLTTFTCSASQYCSTALLTFGVDQTYSYLACGSGPSVEHYLNLPTTPSTTAKSGAGLTRDSTLFTATKTSLTSVSHTSSNTSPRATSTTITTPSSQDHGSSAGPNNIAAIIGGSVAGLVVLCASAIALTYIIRRHRNSDGVRNENIWQAAGSEGFNPTKTDNGPKNREIPSELSADPTQARHVELPG